MNNRYKRIILSAGLALLTATASSLAQTPAPSNNQNGQGADRVISSSIEFGVRGLSVDGDHEKYKSDLNYRAGFRLYNSSLYFEDHTSGFKLMDTGLFQVSGFGSDPSGSARMNIAKTGAFKLDTNFRRVNYYNNLKNHTVIWSEPIPTQSQHKFDTQHDLGDIDLTVFPESEKFRMRFGYSWNSQDGPGAYSLRWASATGYNIANTPPTSVSFRGEEYMSPVNWKSNAKDFRLGVEGQLLGFNMGLNYGHRMFNDGTIYNIGTFNPGNDPQTTQTTIGYINLYNRTIKTKGSVDYASYYLNRTFAEKFDFSGRFIYSSSVSKPYEETTATGVSGTGSTRYLYDADTSYFNGYVKRPQSRADIGLTYRANDKFRISNTFTFDQFNLSGGNVYAEALYYRSFVLPGTIGATQNFARANTSDWRQTGYRRYSNLLEGDVQVNNQFAFNLGYRYTRRKVDLAGYTTNLVLATTTASGEEEENSTNTFIAGARIKPVKNWAIFADAEFGNSDNVFTRLANNDYWSFRVRSRTTMDKFALNLAFIWRNNDSPGRSDVAQTGTLAAVDTTATTDNRYIAGNLEWTPNSRVTFSTGYTYTYVKAITDIIVPVGAPINPSTVFTLGKSEYYVKDNTFFVDVNGRLSNRFSLYAAFRIDDDAGQGSKVATRPQDFITGYPMRNWSPEFRGIVKITRNIDWSVGYQYFSYSETPYFNPFSAVTYPTATTPYLFSQNFPAQNYKAHMPYTSLRIYFGGNSADR